MAEEYQGLTLPYLERNPRYRPIDSAEEKGLVLSAQHGSSQALQKVVEANLRYLAYYVEGLGETGREKSEMISEGSLGLIRAVDTFDPSRGVRFFSYAVQLVKEAIRKRGAVFPVERDEEEDDGELIEDLAARDVSELWNGVGFGSSSELMGRWFRRIAEQHLDDREQKVVLLYSGALGPKPSLREMGEALGVTGERIRQIRNEAFNKLRRSPEGRDFKFLWSDW